MCPFYLSPNLNCPICFFQWPGLQYSFSIKLLHRFSDLYSFHKSYSSQVSIYLTLGTSYRCTKGYFTQCRGVAHNSTFPDFPQSVQLFVFTFQYLAPMGHHFIPILTQYGAITIPYICCFVWGNYHPVRFQWGINPSHSRLLFIAHYISPH